jgi:bacterial/archaeal transporter family-2 protein
MLKLVLTAIALAIGISFSVQSGINAALARGIGSSVAAAMISFGVGFTALSIIALATGQLQAAPGLRHLPVWLWLSGGLLGAFIVFGSIFLVPRIGVAALAAFIIAGQLAAASVIDHFGLFGVPVIEMHLWRAVGIVLLFAGALLVRFT